MRNVTCALVLGVAAATAMPALAQKAFDEGPDVTGLRSRGVYTPRQPVGERDVMAADYGNGYFYCGGASGPGTAASG
ncbi:MAG: hypothetical protein U1F49_13140 [Rubrivivax sp.]